MDDTAKRPAADGCAACWAEEADAAWAAHRGLTAEARLVDESHFDVALLRCAILPPWWHSSTGRSIVTAGKPAGRTSAPGAG